MHIHSLETLNRIYRVKGELGVIRGHFPLEVTLSQQQGTCRFSDTNLVFSAIFGFSMKMRLNKFKKPTVSLLSFENDSPILFEGVFLNFNFLP